MVNDRPHATPSYYMCSSWMCCEIRYSTIATCRRARIASITKGQLQAQLGPQSRCSCCNGQSFDTVCSERNVCPPCNDLAVEAAPTVPRPNRLGGSRHTLQWYHQSQLSLAFAILGRECHFLSWPRAENPWRGAKGFLRSHQAVFIDPAWCTVQTCICRRSTVMHA